MAEDKGQEQQGLLVDTAKLVAGWDAKQAMMVLGVLSTLVGGYVFVGAVNPGALPYTDGLKPSLLTYVTAALLLIVGLGLILRSASQGYVEKVDKANGMGIVHWTHPQQKFYLRSFRVAGHRDEDVWMDVCCGKSHLPQKVAAADDGWIGNFYLDLADTKGITEVTFYRADEAASDALDARMSKANENRKFRHISEQSWPKTGLEELFTMQVENA